MAGKARRSNGSLPAVVVVKKVSERREATEMFGYSADALQDFRRSDSQPLACAFGPQQGTKTACVEPKRRRRTLAGPA